MKKIQKLYDEVRIYQRWENWILDEDDDVSEEFSDIWNEFLDSMREYIIEHSKSDISVIVRKLSPTPSNEIRMEIERILNNITQYYYCFNCLRTLELENPLKVKMIIQQILEKGIVKIEIGLLDQYGLYGFQTKEEFKNLVFSLKTLTEYYINKNWTEVSICDDFKNETRLSDEICNFYVSILEKNRNYMISYLQLKYLTQLNEKLNSYESEKLSQ